MDINAALKTELPQIHHRRNRIGYLPSIAAILVSDTVQHEKLQLDPLWIAILVLIIGGSVMRFLVGEFFFPQWARGERWAVGGGGGREGGRRGWYLGGGIGGRGRE